MSQFSNLINQNINLFHVDMNQYIKENQQSDHKSIISSQETDISLNYNPNNTQSISLSNLTKTNRNTILQASPTFNLTTNLKTNNENENCYVQVIYLSSLNSTNKMSKENSKRISTILLKKSKNHFSFENENNEKNELFDLLSSNEKIIKNFPLDYTNEIISDLCNELKENNYININKIQKYQSHLNNFFQLRIVYFNFFTKLFTVSNLNESTYFLTLDIFDKYISSTSINENEFLLLLMTSFELAVKYNEVNIANLDDIVKICNYKFTKEQILKYEVNIMKVLNYSLGASTIFDLFQFIQFAKNMDNKSYNLGLFLIEMFIIVGGNLKYSSIIILEAVYLLVLEGTNQKVQNLDLYKYLNIDNLDNYKNEIQNCLNDLKKECLNAKNGNMIELINKFANEKYHNISKEFNLIP